MIAQQKPQQQFIFNIGTGKQHSIKDIVATMEQILKKSLDIEWNASKPRPWEFKNWQADIEQAKSVLGWKPNHTLQTGLKNTLSWFEKHNFIYQTMLKDNHVQNAIS